MYEIAYQRKSRKIDCYFFRTLKKEFEISFADAHKVEQWVLEI